MQIVFDALIEKGLNLILRNKLEKGMSEEQFAIRKCPNLNKQF